MKPFDLEKAKAGDPVITGSGASARIVCFDRVGRYPIVALLGDAEIMDAFDLGGCSNAGISLYMKSVKKIGWVNIYPSDTADYVALSSSVVYPTQEAADTNQTKSRVCCVPVEWEE